VSFIDASERRNVGTAPVPAIQSLPEAGPKGLEGWFSVIQSFGNVRSLGSWSSDAAMNSERAGVDPPHGLDLGRVVR
jgi:hypothetical protein